jgi:hypothetical protein
MSATKLAEALRLGREGAPPTEAERLLFEEWMRGHCWALCATWNGTQYVHEAEAGGDLYPPAMNTRQLFAAWRDRAALASYEAAQAEAKPATCPVCGGSGKAEQFTSAAAPRVLVKCFSCGGSGKRIQNCFGDSNPERDWIEAEQREAALEAKPAPAVEPVAWVDDSFTKQLADLLQAAEAKLCRPWHTLQDAMSDRVFHQARAIMGTNTEAQDNCLRMAILHVLGVPVSVSSAPLLAAAPAAPAPDRTGMTYYKNNDCKAVNADAADCICWTPAPATPAHDRVPMPQNADQAAAMVSIGMAWLEQHAPDRLAAPAASAPEPLSFTHIDGLAAVDFPSKQWNAAQRFARAIERAHGIGIAASKGEQG